MKNALLLFALILAPVGMQAKSISEVRVIDADLSNPRGPTSRMYN
jgi:hypothetical protein